MKLRFEEKSDISAKDPCVVIQAERLSDQAREVMDYLEQFSVVNQVVIPTNFQHHINRRSFLQISRHAVMNIDHLESLSDSFSGNMMAKMTGGVKSSVSRKYVKSLMDYLGV